MKKIIDLTINNEQYAEKLNPNGAAFMRELELEDTVEIRTTGTLYTKNDSSFITYDESEEAGLQDFRCMIKVKWKNEEMTEPQSVQIKRYSRGSQDDMDMTLEKGVLNLTRYKVPGLPILDLEIYTIKVAAEIDIEGNGRISVDYRIRFDSEFSRRSMLDIVFKVQQDEPESED